MNLCKYTFIVLCLAIFYCLDSVQAAFFKEGEFAKSLIAYEDTEKFFREMDKLNKGYGENWIVMPDGNGEPIFSKIDKKNFYSATSRTDLSAEKLLQKVKLFLHTLEQPEAVEIEFNSLDKIKLNSSSPVRIICHGWMADSESSLIQNVKEAYLSENYDNVIAVDWSSFAHDYFYPSAALSTHSVGKHLGQLIDNLVEMHGIQYKDIHLIGHSLGAHVAGFAGSSVKEKVGRITGEEYCCGSSDIFKEQMRQRMIAKNENIKQPQILERLDPALPGFQYIQGLDGRLDASDASFVDVIHTCSGLLGMSVPLGHVDFYPNGGSPFQPGCCNNILLSSQQACSHSRSHEYFAESIKKHSKFLAVKCTDWEHFKNKNCDDIFTLMGEHVSKNLTGTFYLKTNEEQPFYKGLNGTIF